MGDDGKVNVVLVCESTGETCATRINKHWGCEPGDEWGEGARITIRKEYFDTIADQEKKKAQAKQAPQIIVPGAEISVASGASVCDSCGGQGRLVAGASGGGGGLFSDFGDFTDVAHNPETICGDCGGTGFKK